MKGLQTDIDAKTKIQVCIYHIITSGTIALCINYYDIDITFSHLEQLPCV